MFELFVKLYMDLALLPALLFLIATASLVAGVFISIALLVCHGLGICSVRGLNVPGPGRIVLLSMMLCVGALATGLTILGVSYLLEDSASFLSYDLSLNRRAIAGIGMLMLGSAGFTVCYWLAGFYPAGESR